MRSSMRLSTPAIGEATQGGAPHAPLPVGKNPHSVPSAPRPAPYRSLLRRLPPAIGLRAHARFPAEGVNEGGGRAVAEIERGLRDTAPAAQHLDRLNQAQPSAPLA